MELCVFTCGVHSASCWDQMLELSQVGYVSLKVGSIFKPLDSRLSVCLNSVMNQVNFCPTKERDTFQHHIVTQEWGCKKIISL